MILTFFVRNALLFIVIFVLANITAEPLRTVRDISGESWEEYFDERTQHFYYFNTKTKETSWLLDFSKTSSVQSWVEDEREGGKADVIDEIFPVQLSKSNFSFEVLGGVHLVDLEEVRMRKDVAGSLQTQHVRCMFDHLVGVRARVDYPMALKAPVAFHHMFISDDARQDNVARERAKVEEALRADPEGAENWETLGHVWRVYGNVHRAMDCYRRALELAPQEKSSFYINLAGLLDQMNFAQDALEVLDVMMTSFDAFTADTESNLALGYVMAAQLHVRLKTTSNLTLASQMIDAALALHPQFFNAIYGLRQEIHYKNYSFGGPPWLLGGTGSWGHLKSPWLIADAVSAVCACSGLSPVVSRVKATARAWPLTSLFVRKCLNASPALLAGVLTRFVVLRGGYLPLPGAGNLPAFLPMSLCLHLSLSTEYFLTDCLLLLLVGFLVSHEKSLDSFLRSVKAPQVRMSKKSR